jgi:hypothetical protein
MAQSKCGRSGLPQNAESSSDWLFKISAGQPIEDAGVVSKVTVCARALCLQDTETLITSS